MTNNSRIETLKKNYLRYILFIVGFLLLVYPFGLLPRLVFYLQGSLAPPDLHRICYRMTVEGFFTGRYWFSLLINPIWISVLVIIGVAFFLGPLFCGLLCPVGSVSESLSRLVPKRFKLYVANKVNVAAIRYGFLAAFLTIPILGLITNSTPVIGGCCPPPTGQGPPTTLASQIGVASVCCRFCASSVLQNIVTGITVDPTALMYWHEGAIIMLVFWLFIGGVFMVGGRGYCNFFCPLGAFSNIFHSIGSKLKSTFKIKHDGSKCTGCGKCTDICPTQAIVKKSPVANINRYVCNCCRECVNACPQKCFSYGRG